MNKNLYMIPKNYLPLFPDAFIGPFYSGLGFALFFLRRTFYRRLFQRIRVAPGRNGTGKTRINSILRQTLFG